MRTILALLAACLTSLLSGCATSVLSSPCDKPGISNAALPTVYMVLVPYSYRAFSAMPSELHETAAQAVNETAGLQMLRMAAETNDMHVTLLRGSNSECQIEPIYQAFSRGRLNRNLLSNVVFYWGEVYQSNDKVLVQSHLRVLWKDSSDQYIQFSAQAGEQTPPLRFTANLPYSTTSFTPRLLSLDGTGSLLNARSALRARVAPHDDAAEVTLPNSFMVMKREGKWVEVRGASVLQSAWVSLRDGDSRIDQLLPELSFANAVASYISYGERPMEDTFRNTRKWLDEFRRGYADDVDTNSGVRPLAIADAIEGALLLHRRARPEHREKGRMLLDQAANMLSTNSAVLNLAAVSEIDTCCTSKKAATRIHQRLQLARKLDAGNEIIARNLLNWYRLLESKSQHLWPDGLTDLRQQTRELAEALGEPQG